MGGSGAGSAFRFVPCRAAVARPLYALPAAGQQVLHRTVPTTHTGVGRSTALGWGFSDHQDLQHGGWVRDADSGAPPRACGSGSCRAVAPSNLCLSQSSGHSCTLKFENHPSKAACFGLVCFLVTALVREDSRSISIIKFPSFKVYRSVISGVFERLYARHL